MRPIGYALAFFITALTSFFGCNAATPLGPLAATQLSASPDVRLADGNATVTIELIARDATGTPLPNVAVEFAVSPAGPVFSSPVGLTDATGSAQTSLQSAVVGNFTVSANLLIGGQALSAPNVAQVSFVNEAAPVTAIVGPAASATSFLALLGPAQVGEQGIGVGVNLRDAQGIAITNTPVTLASSVPSDVISPVRARTTSYGVATMQLVATLAGPRTLSATSNGLTIQKAINVLPGNANVTNSVMSITPNTTLVGNGNWVATLNVTLFDDYLNPLGQQAVTLAASQNGLIGSSNVVTNAAGGASSLVGAQGGVSVAFTAISNSTSISLVQSFVEPLVSNISLAQGVVSAGAGEQIVANIQAAQPSGLGLPNAAFALFTPSVDASFSPKRGMTDANGQVQSTISFSLFGNHQILATLGGNQSVSTSFFASPQANSCPNATFTLPLAPSVALRANAIPFSIVAADFNGDGAQDIAVTDVGTSPQLWVLINDGSDGFGAAQTYALMGNAFGLAAGSLRSSGVFDLVVPQSDGNAVLVLFNQGNGSFTAGPSLPVGLAPKGVVIADFDGDGKNDIAVANSADGAGGNSVTVWYNDGNAKFTTSLTLPTDRGPTTLVAGLLNNDTLYDLAVAHSHNNTFATFVAQPNRTFSAASLYATNGNVVGIALGDINGDGFYDAAITSSQSPFVQTFLGSSTGALASFGTYANVLMSPAAKPRGCALSDINADGKLDLLVADTGLVSWLGDGNGHFFSSAAYGGLDTAPSIAAFAGKAGAPNARIALAPSPKGHEIFVYAHLERQSVASEAVFTGASARDFQAADITGDNLSDLIVPDYNTTAIKLFAASGNAQAAPYNALASLVGHINVTNVAVADFTGDGVLDIAALNASQPGLDIFVAQGNGAFLPAKNTFLPARQATFAAADLDNDGRSDLLFVPQQSNQIVAWRATGGGNFAVFGTYATAQNATILLTGDVVGNGFSDIIVAGSPGDANVYVHLNSNATLSAPILSALVAPPLNIALADIDGDGILDIVALAQGSISWYRGNASGTFSLANTVAIQMPTNFVDAALLITDVTGDDVPDVLWAVGGVLGVATNDGLGNLTLRPDSFVLPGPRATLRLSNASSFGLFVPLFVSDAEPELLLLPSNGCPG